MQQQNTISRRKIIQAVLTILFGAWTGCVLASDTSTENNMASPQQRRGFGAPERGVYKSRITPHWFQNDTRFWYTNDLRGGAREYILVDAEKGTRVPAFDHQKLAATLSKASGQEFKADRLSLSDLEFMDEGRVIQFKAADKSWKCNLNSYECTEGKNSASITLPASNPSDQLARLDMPDDSNASPFIDADENSSDGARPSPGAAMSEPSEPLGISDAAPIIERLSPQTQADQNQSQGQNQSADRPQRRGRRGDGGRDVTSPDEKWTAFVRDYNVFVRSKADGKEVQLSDDGKEGNAYGRFEWSPSSHTLVGWRIEPGDRKEVYLIQSSPSGGGRAVLRTRPYAQAGDKFTRYEINVFDPASHKQRKPEVDRYEHEYETPRIHWTLDQNHFAYEQEDRGHQRLRVIDVDCQSGAVRNLVDEKTKTFIWTAHTENLGVSLVNWLEKTDEMIYVSEMDGWRHFYLVDAKAGTMKQITKGEWVVRGLDKIDEANRQIWFRAGGMNADQDPYFIHYYRINFDGSGLVALTRENGNHTVQYSPDRKYLIDTYSRIDTPPVHELRRAADGGLVCTLEKADITELKESGWEPPEVFVAKGRDGKTDIWGIINRPHNLDPSKKYPILESIYSGPQGAYVPKSFTGGQRNESLLEAGFVLVQMDGMGTAFRSKAFHDVCWHNLKDAGFEDRILWIKAAAAKYPYLDLTRVGIYGTSAGGQNAAAAVLFHPEFYKAAVANSGCHDNRLDKASWNEQWMGSCPDVWSTSPDNWYSQCSNIDNAAKLKGKLMLVVGELDDNVPPESTFRFVDALTKARKDFELVVVPGANHGAASPITQRRLQDFFIHNLMGTEPPNRNANGDSGG